jgi:ADP-ribosyl-[dinitrogen reductase] hydrolase
MIPSHWRTLPAHVRGLLGTAIGDNLGLPFENAGVAARGPFVDFGFRPSVWSDDTQQALVLLDEFLREGALAPRAVMDRFVAMRRDAEFADQYFGLHRGTGRGFRHAVEQYEQRGEFAPLPTRHGNGASMRVVPVALAMAAAGTSGSPWEAQLRAVSEATHPQGPAIDAALAVAHAAWALHAGCDRLATIAGRVPEGVARRALMAASEAPSLASALDALTSETEEARGAGHALGGPLSAIVIAWFAEGFEAAVTRAIELGGDTDSTAAIVGGLALGARGFTDVPEAWWKFEGAAELMGWATSPYPDQIALERALCTTYRRARGRL